MGGLVSLVGTAMNWILYLAVAAGFHYLWAAPLYRIARKRGMRAAWLGWVPVISAFLLLAIADDIYRRRRRRAPLLLCGLIVTGTLLALAALDFLPDAVLAAFPGSWYAFSLLLSLAGLLAAYVVLQLALYRLYTEYKYHNAVPFTVLGVFTPIAVPIFLFTCRGANPRTGW